MSDSEKSEWVAKPSEDYYLKDLSKDPGNNELLKEYKGFLEATVKRWIESKDYHLPSLRYFQRKISFLKAQEEEDYATMQKVASECNPNWLAIVSRPAIINCGRPDSENDKRLKTWWKSSHKWHREKTLEEWQENHPSFKMDFVCPKKWH